MRIKGMRGILEPVLRRAIRLLPLPFVLLLPVEASHASQTFVHMWTSSSDFSDGDRVIHLSPVDGQFHASMTFGDTAYVTFLSNDHSDLWSFQFAPPAGQALGPGRYDDAAAPVFRRTGQPGLGISGGPLDCSQVTGTFEILRLQRNGSTLTSFWAKFEQSCEAFSGITRGEIRFEVEPEPYLDAPLTVAVQRTDAFAVGVAAWGFPERPPVIQATGAPAGSEFRDNGDGTATLYWRPGFMQGGLHDVTVRADDGLGRTAAAMMRLDIGGVTSVLLEGDPGPVYEGLREFYTPRDAELFGRAWVISNLPLSYVELALRSNRVGGFRAQFAGPDGTLPQPGLYENVAAVGRQAPGQAGIQITANAHSCSNVTGQFEVKQAEYGPFDIVRSFWATFEVHCEGLPPALRGELRLNADTPVWLQVPAHATGLAGTMLGFPLAAYSESPGAIALEASGLPASASFFDFGDGNGLFFWTPALSDLGPTRVSFTARDSQGQTDTLATDIMVFHANDDIDQAASIVLPFRTTLDPFWASRAGDDPECGYAGNNTVWYTYTPTVDTRLDLDTVGGTEYTALGVFTGTRGSLTTVACGSRAILDLPVSAGVTYFIMTGTSQSGIPLTLAVDVAPPVPANDDFDAATPIGSLPFVATRNMLLATRAADDPSFFPTSCPYAYNSVWFSFTPPGDVRAIANTKGSDFRTILAAFVGTRGALSPVACDSALDGTPPQIELDLRAGVTYYFMVSFLFEPLNAGNLSFLLIPVLEVEIGIDRVGALDRSSGTVTLQGSVTCSRPIAFEFTVDLGRGSSTAPHAGAIVDVACDGETRWSAFLDPRPGPGFRPGRTRATARASLFDPRTDESMEARTDELVRLSPERTRGTSGPQ